MASAISKTRFDTLDKTAYQQSHQQNHQENNHMRHGRGQPVSAIADNPRP